MCDFRIIYRLSWWEQVESGDAQEVEVMVAGLKLRPDSLYRASTFTRNPPAAGGEGRSHLGWLGWSQETALLLEIRNMLAPKQRLNGPSLARDDQPTTAIGVLQQLRRR